MQNSTLKTSNLSEFFFKMKHVTKRERLDLTTYQYQNDVVLLVSQETFHASKSFLNVSPYIKKKTENEGVFETVVNCFI